MCGLVAHLVIVANCYSTCFLEAQFQIPLKLEFFFQASFLQLFKLQPIYKQLYLLKFDPQVNKHDLFY